MIFDRLPETERLIEILGRAQIGDQFTFPKLAEMLGHPNRDLRPCIASARSYLKKKYKIIFGAIRGVGIQRMSGNEIAFGGLKRVRHIARQAKQGTFDNQIAKGGALSKEAQGTVATTEVIFEKLKQETKGIDQKIKIATIDGISLLDNVLANKK